MHPTERLDLGRLQNLHREARCAQMFNHASLVTAGRLDADPLDLGLGQSIGKRAPAGHSVGHLPTLAAAMNSNIELAFGCIDSRRRHASLCHLR